MLRFACLSTLSPAFSAVCLALAGWLLIAAPASSADLPALHYVAGRFPPYTQLDAANTPAGPTAALIAALGRRLNRTAELTVVPSFARALTIAEHEPNTLIALIARTPERETKFQWLCPVLDYDVAMFRRRDRPDVVAQTVGDLMKWRIGGVNRDVKMEYLQRNGIPVQIAADEDEVTRLLLHGRIDAMPGHPATVRMRMRELGERADAVVPVMALPELTSRLYLAFGPHTSPEVVDTVSRACRAMIASGDVGQLMQPVLQN